MTLDALIECSSNTVKGLCVEHNQAVIWLPLGQTPDYLVPPVLPNSCYTTSTPHMDHTYNYLAEIIIAMVVTIVESASTVHHVHHLGTKSEMTIAG